MCDFSWISGVAGFGAARAARKSFIRPYVFVIFKILDFLDFAGMLKNSLF
jgi:hypothetical protein